MRNLFVFLILFANTALSQEAPICTENDSACKNLALEITKRDLSIELLSRVKANLGSFLCPPSEIDSSKRCTELEDTAINDAREELEKALAFATDDNTPWVEDFFCEADETHILWLGCQKEDRPYRDPWVPPPRCSCGMSPFQTPSGKWICRPTTCTYRGVPIPCHAYCKVPDLTYKNAKGNNSNLVGHLSNSDIQLEAAKKLKLDYELLIKSIDEEIKFLSE